MFAANFDRRRVQCPFVIFSHSKKTSLACRSSFALACRHCLRINQEMNGLTCREEIDDALPTLTKGVIDYSTGVMVLTFNEIADSSPTTNLDGSKIRLSNTAGDATASRNGLVFLS